MKNKYFNNTTILAITFLILSGVSSCHKFLEPDSPSLFSPSTVFANVYTARMAVIGVYQDLAGDQGYGNRVSCYYPYDNDETMGPAKSGDNDRGDLAHYSATSLNLQLYAPYLQLYQGIERANLCIYYIPKMTLYTTGNAQQIAELRRLYGEALTLRAQFYMELIRNWGDVPAQFLPSELSTPSQLYIGKTNRDTIYNHLLIDLKFAADSLVPWKSQVYALTGDQIDERITQGAVRALRAKIALYRGGYDLRQDFHVEREADYKQFYQIAWTECQTIMNSGEHSLNPSYKAIFKNGICAHTLDNTYNEILFEVAMSGGTSLTDSKLGTYNGPKSDGSITAAVLSGTTTTYTATFAYGSASFLMLPTYFYLFDSTDSRRDVTFAPYDVMADYSKFPNKITAIRDGKFRADWVTLQGTPSISASSYWGLDWPLIRYSDVLLMFAEADNELNGGESVGSAGDSALLAVRTRGYGAGNPLIGNIPTDYAGFFKAIVRERSLEFGGEGIRKYDLKRWGLLGTAIKQTQQNLTTMMTAHTNPATTYMAPPPSYCISGPLPTSMYAYPFDSTGNPSGQIKSFDDSRIWATSFYAKQPSSTSPVVNNKIKASWIGSSITTSFLAYYGIGFTPNHSELYPIPQAVIDASNNVLKQDYGY